MAKALKGIRKHRGGYEVRWTGSDGRPRTKRFPLTAAESELREFREKEVAKVTLAGKVVVRGSFEDERNRFLATMKDGTRRHKDFKDKLAQWETSFKGQRLHTIETAQVNAALQGWQQGGKGNGTLQRLRSTLMSLFNNRAPDLVNPVLKAMAFTPPKPKQRALDLTLLSGIFAKMSPSATKARLMLVFYFGVRPSEVMRLRPRDVQPESSQPHIYVRSSDVDEEGKGTNDRILPILSPAQLAAVKMFVSFDAFGTYSTQAARKCFLRAAVASGLTDDDLIEGETRLGRKRWRVRPYDLRHTFATELRKVADLKDVADALGHQSLATSARYAPKQDAKVADAIGRSAIHAMPTTETMVAQLRAMDADARAALLASL